MRLDVFLTPGELTPGDIAERTVVVIDVLRASSSIVEALASGAKSIYPVAGIEEALRLANTFGRDEVVLCGERKCLPVDGFDLGNSPGAFTSERVAGKTLVMSTTNGTHAMTLTSGAARVYVAALFNLSAVVEELARAEVDPVFICSGRERRFAIEDATCAGTLAARLIERRPGDWAMNDGARAAIALAQRFGNDVATFELAEGGRAIAAAGLEEDLAFCAQVDRHDILPVLHERHISLSAASSPR
jgi:2-phosphosulfolactate phosphatase